MQGYAGLYAGAVDAFFNAARRRMGNVWYEAAAELNRGRAECLQEAYQVREVYKTADEMAEAGRGMGGVMSASPICKKLSTAQQVPKAKRPAWRARATQQTRRDTATIIKAIRKWRPTMVVIEQTSALRTHHAKAYAEMQAALQRLPYVWRHSIVEAADLGAPHKRKRLIWAAARKRGAHKATRRAK